MLLQNDVTWREPAQVEPTNTAHGEHFSTKTVSVPSHQLLLRGDFGVLPIISREALQPCSLIN